MSVKPFTVLVLCVNGIQADVTTDESISLFISDAIVESSIPEDSIHDLATRAHSATVRNHWSHPEWTSLVPSHMNMLRQLDIVDTMLVDRLVPLVDVRPDFDIMFPSLTTLRFSNVPFPWSTLALPPNIMDLSIEFTSNVQPGSVASAPPLFIVWPAHAPSLHDLLRILRQAGRLRTLSLYGAFSERLGTLDITSPPSCPINLPDLQTLVLGGNPRPMGPLIRSLSTPSITKLRIVTSSWSPLQDVPSLVHQMGLSSTHPPKTATIIAGAATRRNRHSIYLNVAVAGGSDITLECLDTESDQWCYMIERCGIGGIEHLVVRDHSSNPPAICPPGSLAWHTISSTLQRVHSIQVVGSARWTYDIPHGLSSTIMPIWPLLRVIDFRLEDNVHGNEVIAMGRWLTHLREAGREVEVRIRGEAMGEAVLRPFLLGFPDSRTVAIFRDWISGDVAMQ